MGKYSELKGKLPAGKRKEDTTEYRKRVEEIKRAHAGDSVPELTKAYRDYRRLKEEVDLQLTEANAHVRAAEELIILLQDEQGLTKFTDDLGNTYYQEVVPQVSVKDMPAAEAWVDKNGYDYLWALKTPGLATLVKEMAVSGEPVPEFFELSAYTKLKLKKGANTGGKASGTNTRASEEDPF